MLESKLIFIVTIEDEKGNKGQGECSTIKGLSKDDCTPEFYEGKLNEVVRELSSANEPDLHDWPGIRFALECAFKDLEHGGKGILFPSEFTEGKTEIPINGLVWMNDSQTMLDEAFRKADDGFDCIKFKVGALDFDEECRMLEKFRKRYTATSHSIRLDANGAFTRDDAKEKLNDLSRFEIHSIEQPVAIKQWDLMERLCTESRIPIALDEELIFCDAFSEGYNLLAAIWPQYLVLKPGLLGGFTITNEWIRLAERAGVKWWITSALESNLGLNAIAQYTATFKPAIPQGLGTGGLFKNNLPGALRVSHGSMKFIH